MKNTTLMPLQIAKYYITILGATVFIGLSPVLGQDTSVPVESLEEIQFYVGGKNVNLNELNISSITLDEYLIQPGDNVWSILENNNVTPNNDAVGVMQVFNPQIDYIGEIRPGETILVPNFDTQLWSSWVESGDSFIVVDPTAREGVAAELVELRIAEAEFDRQEIILPVIANLQTIQDNRNGLGGSTINASRDDAALIVDLVNRGNNTGGEPGSDEVAAFFAAERGLEVRANAAALGANPIVQLSVRTLDETSGTELCVIKVYTVAEGYYLEDRINEKKDRFFKVSSPAVDTRSLGYYRLWAERGTNRVSEYLLIDLTNRTSNGEIEIDLFVNAEAPKCQS